MGSYRNFIHEASTNIISRFLVIISTTYCCTYIICGYEIKSKIRQFLKIKDIKLGGEKRDDIHESYRGKIDSKGVIRSFSSNKSVLERISTMGTNLKTSS